MSRRNYIRQQNSDQNNNYNNEEKIKVLSENLENEKKLKEELNLKYICLNKDFEALKTKYDILLKKYQDNNLNLSELSKANAKLKENLENISSEKRELEKEIQKIKDKNNKEKKKLDNDINIKNRNINELKQEIQHKDNKNIELKKELEQKSSKFDGAINQFQEMSEQLKMKEEKIKELEAKIKHYQEIKHKYDRFMKINEKEKPKEEILKAPSEEFYDAIVDINSIKSLKTNGWKIYYNKEKRERYLQMISEETIKMGVLGLNNVGKTYILSKITNSELPSGYSLETKGISIKYSEGDKGEAKGLCILDSAGFETPLIKDELVDLKETKNINNEFEQNLQYGIEDDLSKDKAQIEKFIELLIINLSDLIILVLGKMTRTEQRLITKIKNLIKKKENNKIKALIIIHNLSHYYYNSEVENYKQNYLLRSATFELESRQAYGIEGYEDRYYYVEKHTDKNEFEVFHYIMAKEGQEAGNTYNDLTMKLIRHQYNNCNIRRKIDIPEEIVKLFSELSPEILGEKKEIAKSNDNENIIKLIEAEELDKKEKKEDPKIPKIQAVYMDQDGNYYNTFDDGKYEPKYSLYYYREKIKKKENDDDDEDDEEENYQNILLLRLELPGNIKKLTAKRTELSDKLYGIILKGKKEKDEFDEKQNESLHAIYDNRTYDDFTYFIKLNKNFYTLSDTTAKGYTKTYTIDFDKRNKETAFQKEKEKKEGKEKEIKTEKIQSGVYVMKFHLIDGKYYKNN